MKSVLRKMLLCSATVLFLALLPSCQSKLDSSNLNLGDVINHFKLNGIEIAQLQPLDPTLVGATEGLAVMIGKQEIGAYKFNLLDTKQRKTIDRVQRDEYIYVMAMKYPATVKGTFMFIGVVNHPEKKKIVDAIATLK